MADPRRRLRADIVLAAESFSETAGVCESNGRAAIVSLSVGKDAAVGPRAGHLPKEKGPARCRGAPEMPCELRSGFR
jgi:hypothetical protein